MDIDSKKQRPFNLKLGYGDDIIQVKDSFQRSFENQDELGAVIRAMIYSDQILRTTLFNFCNKEQKFEGNEFSSSVLIKLCVGLGCVPKKYEAPLNMLRKIRNE